MKLHQLLAIESDVKKSAYADLTKNHHLIQKPASVTGETAIYTPKDENGERLPPQSRLVQNRVEECLVEVAAKQIPHWDLEYQKDLANQMAKAQLVLPNGTVISDVPVTMLLFLEKQLVDLVTYFSKLPVLDPDKVWERDEARDLWVSPAFETAKTAKVQKPVVLYPATEQHPAQTQLLVTDEIVGTWTKQALSGAIPERRRKQLVARAEILLQTVKKAREEANSVQVTEYKVAHNIWDYLLNK